MTREILAAGKPALFISQQLVLLQFRGFMWAGLFLFSFFKGTGIKKDGSIGTYTVDNDRVLKVREPYDEEEAECVKQGCNWMYLVREGNDD